MVRELLTVTLKQAGQTTNIFTTKHGEDVGVHDLPRKDREEIIEALRWVADSIEELL